MNASRVRSRRLQYETLETRQVMAAGLTASLNAAGVLNIVGTDSDDQVLLRQIGKAISISGADGSWLASKVHSIVIDVRAGDDFVSLNSFANGGNKALKEKVSVWSGAGQENVQLATNHNVRFGGVGHQLYIAPGAAPKLDNATLNLSSSVTAKLASGVLTITGTNAADSILLRQSRDKIYLNGLTSYWNVSKVNSIVIHLQDGDDYVSLDSLANGGNQVLSRAVTVNSGNGNECVHLANGHDVSFSGLGHVLHSATNGTVTLDGQVLNWDPAPTPDPEPDPTPPPPPPPTGNWFDVNIQDAALRSLGSSLYVDGLIDRSDIMSLFDSAKDESAVSSTEFTDFQLIVGNVSLFGGAEHVWKLTSYIVSGNTANANYQGQTLGNLAAGSTDAQLSNLVNKWFLGLDRPTAPYAYTLAAGTLFVNGATYADIDQGNLGNCAFMASLSETALRSPGIISSMFVVNGDGTYTVRFYHSGIAEYVTVDSYLPTNASGNFVYALGGKLASNSANELWVALAEKAFAQIGEMSWFGRQNNYASIASQYAFTTLSQITGQSTIGIAYTSSSTSLTTFANAWSAGKLICLITYANPPSSGIVANHAYAVVGFDATTSTVTLFNPWGSSYGLTTLAWSDVQANFHYFDRTV